MQRKSGSYKSSTPKRAQSKRRGSAHNKGQLPVSKTSKTNLTSKAGTNSNEQETATRLTQAVKSPTVWCKSIALKSGLTIEIPEYITHVTLSKSRRPKYYQKGQKIPKKYAKFKTYDLKGRLLGADGHPIVANAGVVNKPREQKINGQQLYSGNMNPMMRSKVVGLIKEFFQPFTANIDSVAVPVRIEADLYCPMAAKNWDLDNQWIYHKCFLDSLVKNGVLPDDNIMFVTQAPGFRYFPVDHKEDRKLVYRLIPEDRPEILQHGAYISYHSETESDESLNF
jgi:Holliday junction resolvase RusA-like endonuclease